MEKKNNLNSQEKIINSAVKEFAEHGFGGARVDRIAENAGVNKAMIYYHYKSKEVLYETIIKDFTGSIIETISSVPIEGNSPKEQLFSILTSYADFISRLDKNILKLFLREIVGGGKYFKKIAIPNLVIPAFLLIDPIFKKAVKKGEIRDVNLRLTFLQVIGSILFFNIIQIPLEGSILDKVILKGDFHEDFKKNMMGIIKNGIILNKEKRK